MEETASFSSSSSVAVFHPSGASYHHRCFFSLPLCRLHLLYSFLFCFVCICFSVPTSHRLVFSFPPSSLSVRIISSRSSFFVIFSVLLFYLVFTCFMFLFLNIPLPPCLFRSICLFILRILLFFSFAYHLVLFFLSSSFTRSHVLSLLPSLCPGCYLPPSFRSIRPTFLFVRSPSFMSFLSVLYYSFSLSCALLAGTLVLGSSPLTRFIFLGAPPLTS